MRIVFPHIPKCAGSSVKKQLAQRSDVHFDYFNHPTWVYDPDIESGTVAQNKLKVHLRKLDDWIVFGHFAASAYDDVPYDLKIILLRDPVERAISQFHYMQQLLPDNEVTRRRNPEVAPIKDGLMTIDQFADLHHIKHFYSEFYLSQLIRDDRLIVLSIGKLEASYNKIHEASGIRLDPVVWENRSAYGTIGDELRDKFSVDTALYHELLESHGN